MATGLGGLIRFWFGGEKEDEDNDGVRLGMGRALSRGWKMEGRGHYGCRCACEAGVEDVVEQGSVIAA